MGASREDGLRIAQAFLLAKPWVDSLTRPWLTHITAVLQWETSSRRRGEPGIVIPLTPTLTRPKEADFYKFKTSLVYMASFRMSRDKRGPVSKNQINKNKNLTDESRNG